VLFRSDYGALDFIFSTVKLSPADVIVDVGCGKGRVINYLLHKKSKNRIIGVELDSDIAAFTRRRLRRYRNVEIRNGNILDSIPEDATMFYLFNPFNADVMGRFKAKLEAVFDSTVVIYYNANYADIFENAPGWTVTTHPNPAYHKLSIASYEAGRSAESPRGESDAADAEKTPKKAAAFLSNQVQLIFVASVFMMDLLTRIDLY
jgi:SAM-dependent methyltransferase